VLFAWGQNRPKGILQKRRTEASTEARNQRGTKKHGTNKKMNKNSRTSLGIGVRTKKTFPKTASERVGTEGDGTGNQNKTSPPMEANSAS